MSYWLNYRRIGVRFQAEERDISPLHNIQTGSGARQAFYAMGTGRYFPGNKAAGA